MGTGEGAAQTAPPRAFWERVDREAARLGWGERRLAKEAGIGHMTVRRKLTPQRGTVVKIADAVGLDRDEALALAGILESAEAPTLPGGIQREISTEPEDPEIEALLAGLKPEQLSILRRARQQELDRLRAEAAEARRRWHELVRGTAEEGQTGDN
jgi:hypothetical protein